MSVTCFSYTHPLHAFDTRFPFLFTGPATTALWDAESAHVYTVNIRYACRLRARGTCPLYVHLSVHRFNCNQPSCGVCPIRTYSSRVYCVSPLHDMTYVSAVLVLHSVHAPVIRVRLSGQLQPPSGMSNSHIPVPQKHCACILYDVVRSAYRSHASVTRV